VSAGVLIDRYGLDWRTSTWGVIALGGVLVAFACLKRTHWLGSLAILTAWLALGGGWHHHRWSDLPGDDLAGRIMPEPTLCWLRGVVNEVPSFRPGVRADEPGTTRTVLDVGGLCDGLRWHPASGQVQVLITGNRTDLRCGDVIEAAGMLSALPGPLNPGEFDYRAYLRTQGVRLRLSVGDPQSVWPDRASRPRSTSRLIDQTVARWLGAARVWSYTKLVAGLDPRIAPLAAALLLGRREGVEPEVNDAFARTGTTHLLAISGLHLQVLAGVLWLVCRAVGMPRRRSFLTVSLVTIGYALLVGLAPSVVRSAAMTVTICVGSMRDRTARPANVLALAAIVTMLLNPAHLFDVGCQLSFLAVAAIVWGVPPVLRWIHKPLIGIDALERENEPGLRKTLRRWGDLFVQGVVVSVVVWLVTLPLVALRFHVVSPIGVILNVPLIPLTSLALLAAGLTLMLAGLWAPLGGPVGWACAWLLELTERIVRWGAAQPWGHAFEPGPPCWWVIGFYVGLTVAAIASAAHWRAWKVAWSGLGVWVVLGLVLGLSPHRPGALEADVLAVGHGLAVVLQTADGRVVVYDCGRMGDPSVGRRVVAPALWSRGVRHIDAIVLSHADADHYNGVPDLLERFSVGCLRIPPTFAGARNPWASRLLEQVRQRGIPVQTMAAGERWRLGPDAIAWALHPPRGWRPDASDNNHSLVLDLASVGRHLLLTGDLEQTGQADVIAQPTPSHPLDALLAPHHGGRSASPPWFFDWADPRRVIVSQRRPVAGARDALAFLDARGAAVWRTWERGAIRLRWESVGINARGYLDEEAEASSARASFVPTSFVIATGRASSVPGWLRLLIAVLGLIAGLGLCGVLAVMEWGAWILVRPGRRLRAGEPEPSPWQPLTIETSDGITLSAAWRPADGPVPSSRTALILHGFVESRSAMRSRAEGLVPYGWNVLLPDARGHGQSGGHHASFGGREADDLRAWIDALSKENGGSPAVFITWGRSMGAAVAVRAAAADPRIRALVLEAPYPDLESAVAGWLGRLRVPRRLAHLIVHRAAALAGVSLSRPRPIDLAPEVRVPTLILHGTADPIVRLADARRLAEAFPTPAALVEVQGARHVDVMEVGGAALMERIVDSINVPG
jgi:competence protein ComEC